MCSERGGDRGLGVDIELQHSWDIGFCVGRGEGAGEVGGLVR